MIQDNNLAMFEEISNPLDGVEEFLSGNDWIFNRTSTDELTVNVTGRAGTYRMAFIWQEEFSAMQFFCEYDLRIPKERQELTGQALRVINERIWLG
ncbi:MAG TPA: YbjN domain-containing protein, partial [Patescibacteria group bacterium]|nr:YbjN domain-containing protein [Patescibacteria group bacterium]